MLFIVKNTTISSIFDIVCPHLCRGCGRIGKVLCECCKNNITGEHLNYCPKCKKPIKNGECEDCKLPFLTFMVGWRDEKIGELAEEYKFYSVRAMAEALAEILDETLPYFADEVIIVPLPTIEKHKRERGLDHTLAVAKKLAKRRGWKVGKVIERAVNTVQVGANAKERVSQAKRAYKIKDGFAADSKRIYLLFDDIWTTGASIEAAAKLMQKAGVKNLVASVLAVNRYGKKPIIKRQDQ